MSNYLKQPISGLCLPCCWTWNGELSSHNYKPSSPCIPGILIYDTHQDLYHQFAVKFASFDLCTGSDYVHGDSGAGFFWVDVWTARTDGVWTTSVTIEMWSYADTFATSGIIIAKNGWLEDGEEDYIIGGCTPVQKGYTIPPGTPPFSCPASYAKYATVTVNANGTFSIA